MRLPLTASLAGAFFMLSGSALAQQACLPAIQIERILKQRYNESQASVAVSNGGVLIERWESPQGTWTLLRRTHGGQLCVIVSGENWREVPRELQGAVL